jgi:hypothetical protein
MLTAVLAGASPAGGTYPVTTVVISGDGAGDQAVGSPDVKVLVGWAQVWSDPSRRASKSTGRSVSEPGSFENKSPAGNGLAGSMEVPSPSKRDEGQSRW